MRLEIKNRKVVEPPARGRELGDAFGAGAILMAVVVGALAAGACTTGAPAEERPVPPPASSAPPASDPPLVSGAPPAGGAQVVAASDAAPSGPVAAGPADSGGTAPAPPQQRRVEPGTGRCKRDEDCVLSSYQEGCCVQGCAPYAISAKLLEQATSREDCEAFHKSGRPCPPPAPCPPLTWRAISARCGARGICEAISEPVPAPP